jgi:hypothetical protein
MKDCDEEVNVKQIKEEWISLGQMYFF